MRFQEVCAHLLQFEAVRGACSREWQIAPDLVMCVELDLSSYASIPTSLLHTTPRGAGPLFLLVSFFRLGPAGSVHSWADYAGADGEPLHPDEQIVASEHRTVVREWVAGERATLPPSTSTAIASRLRNGHTRHF